MRSLAGSSVPEDVEAVDANSPTDANDALETNGNVDASDPAETKPGNECWPANHYERLMRLTAAISFSTSADVL